MTRATENTDEPRRARRGAHPAGAVITFGKDETGRPYDTVENNPKRNGSKSREVFRRYREGMTVAEAVEAGIGRGFINWDEKKGYIRIAALAAE